MEVVAPILASAQGGGKDGGTAEENVALVSSTIANAGNEVLGAVQSPVPPASPPSSGRPTTTPAKRAIALTAFFACLSFILILTNALVNFITELLESDKVNKLMHIWMQNDTSAK